MILSLNFFPSAILSFPAYGSIFSSSFKYLTREGLKLDKSRKKFLKDLIITLKSDSDAQIAVIQKGTQRIAECPSFKVLLNRIHLITPTGTLNSSIIIIDQDMSNKWGLHNVEYDFEHTKRLMH